MSITVHELVLNEPPRPILVSQEEFKGNSCELCRQLYCVKLAFRSPSSSLTLCLRNAETAQHRCPYSNFLKGKL